MIDECPLPGVKRTFDHAKRLHSPLAVASVGRSELFTYKVDEVGLARPLNWLCPLRLVIQLDIRLRTIPVTQVHIPFVIAVYSRYGISRTPTTCPAMHGLQILPIFFDGD